MTEPASTGADAQQSPHWMMTAQGARVLSAFTASATGTVLALSMWLTPSPLGHATHLQLGLGQCTFLSATGIPCPMCGMTTTFTLSAHLRPIDALLNQPFGVVLFAMTVGAFSLSVAEAIQPTGRWGRVFDALAPYEGRLALLFLLGLGAGWTYKIALMG